MYSDELEYFAMATRGVTNLDPYGIAADLWDVSRAEAKARLMFFRYQGLQKFKDYHGLNKFNDAVVVTSKAANVLQQMNYAAAEAAAAVHAFGGATRLIHDEYVVDYSAMGEANDDVR